MAIKEPWRMAVSFLWSLDPERFHDKFDDFLARWSREKVRIVVRMLERNINTPLTSSCGRVFDAVSCLAGLRSAINYEGQAAIELEQAMEDDRGRYEGAIVREGGKYILDSLPMIDQVVRDVRSGVSPGVLSARFHNGVVALLSEAARLVSEDTGLKQIALSGGVMQNAYLFENVVTALLERGFKVFSHVEVPANDACIALGQAYVAAQWLTKGGQ
jgi:hydrogenase maturation protein HypF